MEAQLRQGDRAWEGSVERNREPMNKNQIRGAMDQGEQARHCKAFVVNVKLRRSGGCAGKDRVLTWGDLVSRLKGRRRKPGREVSRGRSSWATSQGPNEKESWRV